MHLSILGSHPNLSLAELERVYGSVDKHTPSTAFFVGSPYQHLGGSSKVGRVITRLETVDPKAIENYLRSSLANDLGLSDSKFDLGLSFYGQNLEAFRTFPLQLKKHLRSKGYKPRIILPKGTSLSSAQVYHNQLTEAEGYEILISIGINDTYICRTVWVQDINSYSKRDMERPNRDMDVGMLPPKLAQIMINLAGGDYVFDPFCGSGVVLQEALLMNKRTGGSDISPKMVESTRANLDWLKTNYPVVKSYDFLEVEDARKVHLPKGVDTIVTEGYLGPVIRSKPDRQTVNRLANESLELIGDTLVNLQTQLPPKTKLCLAIPAWYLDGHAISPPLVDSLDSLGYNLVSLKSVADTELLYHRKDQYVGRRLILLEKT